MKSNWGPEGLHHAEGLLSSALQIAPDDVNAKILMGYVYAHQQRYPAAEKLFAEADAANPPNLWLWTNWGEVLAMQGKVDQATAKFREAVERPMTHDTHDRAREAAYMHLLALLERKKDIDGMEALYKKSVAEFGDASSFNLQYAYFLLTQRGDGAGAIQHASGALDVECSCVRGREIVGLAHYTIWAKSEGAARAEALNQARIYLPPGPQPLYLLARSEKTAGVAARLIASGEKIGQRDNDKLNALAHAISNDDLQAARRLLRLGAKPETPVGYDDMPVALIPVLNHNLEMVKLLQQFGANYARIRYHGATALDFAKQIGDPGLSELLAQQTQTL
jgi:tetratricopeptide (TPR) repeat protein